MQLPQIIIVIVLLAIAGLAIVAVRSNTGDVTRMSVQDSKDLERKMKDFAFGWNFDECAECNGPGCGCDCRYAEVYYPKPGDLPTLREKPGKCAGETLPTIACGICVPI